MKQGVKQNTSIFFFFPRFCYCSWEAGESVPAHLSANNLFCHVLTYSRSDFTSKQQKSCQDSTGDIWKIRFWLHEGMFKIFPFVSLLGYYTAPKFQKWLALVGQIVHEYWIDPFGFYKLDMTLATVVSKRSAQWLRAIAVQNGKVALPC